LLESAAQKAYAEMELRESFEDDQAHQPLPAQDFEADPEKMTEAEIMRAHLRQALETLSPQQRTVFILRHDEDMPLAEIGKMLDISEGTVKSQLFRALKKLQQALKFYKADLIS
jgi:RNA polymerase sigma-70 factor (ECF subfamily)